MSDAPSDLHGSAKRAIAEGLVEGLAAATPKMAEAADQRRADAAADMVDALRPLVHELVGRHLAELGDEHPLKAMVGQARALYGAAGPGTPSASGTLPHPGGVIDDIVDVFLVILGVIGAAFGILPALGSIVTRQYVQGLNVKFDDAVLQPAELADMVERGVVSEGDGAAEASQSGINATRFGLMTLAAGEPPGIMQALELVRRGEVDLAWFRKVVAYSRVRTEYTDDLLKLGWATMSPADAIELRLKTVADEPLARALFVAGGGLPQGGPPVGDYEGGGENVAQAPDVDQFALLLAAAGNPIGPEAAANLWAHGVIPESRLDQVIAHSRINPQFNDLVKLTHKKWLTVFQIETALKAGTVTAAEATNWLLADGYEADQVAAFVSALAGPAHQKAKADTEAQVVELYEAGMATEPEAVADLGALGYSPASAALILRAAEARRVNAQRTAAIGKVRAQYLAGRLTADKGRAELSRLGVPADAAASFVEAWDVERASVVHTLTAAQVGHLVKVGHWPADKAVARWVAMGYSADDAADLLVIYPPPAPPPPPARPAGAQG